MAVFRLSQGRVKQLYLEEVHVFDPTQWAIFVVFEYSLLLQNYVTVHAVFFQRKEGPLRVSG